MSASTGRIALVTGATGAIGKAIARQLASFADMSLVLVARDKLRGITAADEIVKYTGNDRIQVKVCDLSLRKEIMTLASGWVGHLDILVNNAALTPRSREESGEGVEMQWATNVLGYFRLTRAFAGALAKAADPRVINVASYWAGGLDLEDPEFHRRPYHNDTAYRQSKQANRMLSAVFAELLRPKGISVFSCHPGDVNSNLSNNLGFGGHESPDQGADTPVWLATSVEVGIQESGRYFESRRIRNCSFSRDRGAGEQLWKLCESYDQMNSSAMN